MKKIFTLLFAVGMLSLAQAQTGQRDDRDFDQRNDQRNDQRYDQQNDQFDFDKGYDKKKFLDDNDRFFDQDRRFNDRFSMERRMKMKIGMINQEYDFKIQRVRRSFHMSWYEKQRLIRFLENQRRWEISMVYAKFNNRNRYDDRYDRNRGRDKHSNGRY
jgi:hypothetical protein